MKLSHGNSLEITAAHHNFKIVASRIERVTELQSDAMRTTISKVKCEKKAGMEKSLCAVLEEKG